MADDLKHLDEHSNEIHELVETLVQNHLLEAANANQYCPKCVAVILLEWPPSQQHARVPLPVRSRAPSPTVLPRAKKKPNGWRRRSSP